MTRSRWLARTRGPTHLRARRFRYYDLKTTPSHIRSSLEDFVPWKQYAAIEQFYALLEWVNAPASPLESNDCAFTGPHDNDSLSVNQPLQCTGRVMLFYRALPLNLSLPDVTRMKDTLHRELTRLDPKFEWGVIGTTIVPTRYITLPVPHEEQLGQELMVSFWAWGSTEAGVMKNLSRLFKSLSTALRLISAPS